MYNIINDEIMFMIYVFLCDWATVRYANKINLFTGISFSAFTENKNYIFTRLFKSLCIRYKLHGKAYDVRRGSHS